MKAKRIYVKNRAMKFDNEEKRIAPNSTREALMPFASPWSPNKGKLLNIEMKEKNSRAKFEK